jgi:hypothetical protein
MRSNIYSLGVPLWELISEHHPFPNLGSEELIWLK